MEPTHVVFVANRLVPLTEVLDRLGLEYRGVPGAMRCPVHKLGMEDKPSATIYEDNSIYCFNCARQYGPVDVWAAHRGASPADAAHTLLDLFDVPAAARYEAAAHLTLPPRKTVSASNTDYLEHHLLEHRGHCDLSRYREWCRRIQQVPAMLSELPTVDHERRLQLLRHQMHHELEATDG